MNLPPIIKQVDSWLQGWPDTLLTVGLVVAAVLLVLLALYGNRVSKAVMLAWVIAP